MDFGKCRCTKIGTPSIANSANIGSFKAAVRNLFG